VSGRVSRRPIWIGDGFLTFSKLRPVFYQAPVSGMRLLWPPFGTFADRVLNFLTK